LKKLERRHKSWHKVADVPEKTIKTPEWTIKKTRQKVQRGEGERDITSHFVENNGKRIITTGEMNFRPLKRNRAVRQGEGESNLRTCKKKVGKRQPAKENHKPYSPSTGSTR